MTLKVLSKLTPSYFLQPSECFESFTVQRPCCDFSLPCTYAVPYDLVCLFGKLCILPLQKALYFWILFYSPGSFFLSLTYSAFISAGSWYKSCDLSSLLVFILNCHHFLCKTFLNVIDRRFILSLENGLGKAGWCCLMSTGLRARQTQ